MYRPLKVAGFAARAGGSMPALAFRDYEMGTVTEVEEPTLLVTVTVTDSIV